MYTLSVMYATNSPTDGVICQIEDIKEVIPWLASPPGYIAMWTQPNGDVIGMRNDNPLSVVCIPQGHEPDLPDVPVWLLRGDHPPCLPALYRDEVSMVTTAFPLTDKVGEALSNYPERMLLGPARRWAIVPDDGYGRLVALNVYMARAFSLYRPVPNVDENEATKQ